MYFVRLWKRFLPKRLGAILLQLHLPLAFRQKKIETNEGMGECDGGCSIKSNKTQIATLLTKRLRQKKDHEEQRRKRHKERMEMDENFLKVLEKLANK
ncbi:hypothetical protein WA026_005169 [Henosepilachna vigintioctopunctata]|uniref:Uncharacterized protein n=1 Tax=Henosepilachna vigintioctopunctata TaxID=420089 RepID=A0AAW1UXC3_9CUCU